MKSRLFGVALMAAMMVVPALAQDDAATKKKRAQQRGQQNVTAMLLKQLEAVKLTDEQVSKIKELGKTATAKMNAIREEAGITPELMKKRTEAQKALQESGKKGKELQAAINKEAGLNEAQIAAQQKTAEVRTTLQKQVIALLTDEQKEKLPQNLKRVAGAGENAKAKQRKKKQEN